jgi:hypothetical protein
MGISHIYIGILFTAVVNVIIAITATTFFIFLVRRWDALEDEMRAYCIFYFLTAIAWFWIAIRYTMMGMGYAGPLIMIISKITQSFLVFTGPPLLYYVGYRIFHKRTGACILSLVAFLFSSVSAYLLWQPQGIGLPHIEFFSADAPINKTSLLIFVSEVVFIAILLSYDLMSRLYRWTKSRSTKALYTALYSSGVLVYVAIGGIDQIKLFTGGFLVAFRVLYAAAFLFTYIIIVKRESLEDDYLIEEEAPRI